MTATVLDLDTTPLEGIEPACDNPSCERPATLAVHIGCGCLLLTCQPCLEQMRAHLRDAATRYSLARIGHEGCGWTILVPADQAETILIRSVEAL